MIKQIFLFINGMLILAISIAQQPETAWQFAAVPGWSDEFNEDGLPDTANWSYEIGGHGWGNNELQYYTNGRNVYVKDGVLSISAKKEKAEGKSYTSTRMVTRNKHDFLYGRIEVRAKLPSGRGLWPAIWMMPTKSVYGGWPNSGEIDIMEQVGFDEKTIHFSIHNEAFNWPKNTQKTAQKVIPTATEDFHVYRMDWTPEYIKGFIDGVAYFYFENDRKGHEHWPFDQQFYLILNIAVGGNWGGQKGIDESIFPGIMFVDFVRYYPLVSKK